MKLPHDTFRDLVATHDRIAVVGGPNTGKTTLCARVRDRPVFETDKLIKKVEFLDVPHAMIAVAISLDRFVVEGFQAARSLRKGMPVDLIVWLHEPLVDLTNRQAGMIKSVETVMRSFVQTAPVVHFGGTELSRGTSAFARPARKTMGPGVPEPVPSVEIPSGIAPTSSRFSRDEMDGPPGYDFEP